MSGHSKWSTIKRKKGVNDAKRGKLYTKLIRELTVIARNGGDEEANPRLRAAVQNAKSANMPLQTIERAIKWGTGEEPGVVYEEAVFEGYGPGGIAIIVETLSDNHNRTVSDVRHAFTKYGGALAEKGSVAWMFDQKGLIEVDAERVGEDDLMMAVMDAGAEDLQETEGVREVICPLENFEAIKRALESSDIPYGQSSLAWLPQNLLNVDVNQALSSIKLLEALEDLDDVQKVYSNFDMPEEDLEKLIA